MKHHLLVKTTYDKIRGIIISFPNISCVKIHFSNKKYYIDHSHLYKDREEEPFISNKNLRLALKYFRTGEYDEIKYQSIHHTINRKN